MNSPDKKTLSERDICIKCITPAVEQAGWDVLAQVREEGSFMAGRMILRDKFVDNSIYGQESNYTIWRAALLKNDKGLAYVMPPAGNPNNAWVQDFLHHLPTTGFAVFVLTTGAMSSSQFGEGLPYQTIGDPPDGN